MAKKATLGYERLRARSGWGFWKSLSVRLKVSLVAFVAVIVLWARSYVSPIATTTDDGLNTLIIYQDRIDWKRRSAPNADYINATGRSSGLILFGVGADRLPTAGGTHIWTFVIGCWLLAVLSGIGPAVHLHRFVKAR